MRPPRRPASGSRAWRRPPRRLSAALGPLPIVAENLGFITPDVEELRKRHGLPGMAILQFAFGTDPQAPDFLPHNFTRDRVAYTGTHDNDTMMGWARGSAGDSTRSPDDVARERRYAEAYLGASGDGLAWAAIRAVLASVAETAIIPVQDVLGLGSDARMNVPGRASGNWRWRLQPGALEASHASELRRLADLYGRLPQRARPSPSPPAAKRRHRAESQRLTAYGSRLMSHPRP